MQIGNIGERTMIPYNTNLIPLARKNRKKSTPAESKMWEVLRGRKLAGLKFTRQKPLNMFIADFYCAELLLVVEIDGKIHEKQKDYDEFRSRTLLGSHGIIVIRFTNDEVLNEIDAVSEKLLTAVNERRRVLNPPPAPLP
jgi:very-short-patch-repair endonuclease